VGHRVGNKIIALFIERHKYHLHFAVSAFQLKFLGMTHQSQWPPATIMPQDLAKPYGISPRTPKPFLIAQHDKYRTKDNAWTCVKGKSDSPGLYKKV
jgi:hypothetical protein